MRVWAPKYLMILIMPIMLSCSSNLFEDLADTTSDAALYYDAKRALNQSEWDTAITKIQAMSTAKQAEREIIFMLSSAYAGQCGLRWVTFTSQLSDFGGGKAFFLFLLEHFTGSTAAAQTACQNAEQTYDAITSPTTGDYLNKVYISLSKMGVILNKINRAENANSDTYAVGFQPCTEIVDDDATELFTGLARVVTDVSNAGLGGLGLPACPPLTDCTKTDNATITNTERDAMRAILNATNPGLSAGGGCS